MLQRQLGERARPKTTWADRALIALLLGLIPRARHSRTKLIVSPGTILRWRRDLLRRCWARKSKPKGRPPTHRNIKTLVLRMVQAGLFGDLLYGEGAYLHDLREELFSNKGEGLWRRTVHTERDGNLYPTHGLGPVANYMGIQRGDRFDYIVSMSTPQRGLDVYRKAHVPQGDPKWVERYIDGDMNTSLIKTAKGLTITLKHDVSNPHPYDRINTIAGTKGVFADYPPRIYFDGQAGGEQWGSIDPHKQHQHPLWKEEGAIAQKLGGHGGMDYIMLYRLLQCMRDGLVPDMDVYDAAIWSAPGPLSRQSVEHGSAPVKCPDFTCGHWQKRSASQIATQS